MLFGLCTAPYVFTELLKPVVQKLREMGIVFIIYLDDILIMGKTEEECHRSTQRTIKVLQSMGFVINREKSNLEPSQKCQFLGFIIDSSNIII